jgi:hypothetical protein
MSERSERIMGIGERSERIMGGIPSPEAPGRGTSTVLEQEVETRPRYSHGDGDHERFAHYVRKEKILESALSGEPVTALCGKVWVPGRDPKRFPVCPTCKEIYQSLSPGGESSE